MSDGTGEAKKKGCLLRLVFWVFFLAVMTLAAAIVWVNTGSGRQVVEDRLEKWIGVPLTVEHASFGLPFDLVMKNVESESFATAGEPGFRAEELRIGARLPSRLSVSVHKGVLNLVRGSDGSWAPARFSAIGELPSHALADLSRITSGLRESMSLSVNEGAISWMDSEGQETLSAGGVAFQLVPIAVPRRRMYYYYVSLHTLTAADGSRAHDVEREWLASDTHEYLELYRSSRSVPESLKEFWETAHANR